MEGPSLMRRPARCPPAFLASFATFGVIAVAITKETAA
jgi:hypothetical protein